MTSLYPLAGRGESSATLPFLSQEIADLLCEAVPCRLVREDQVIVAFQRKQARAGNLARQRESELERNRQVAAAVDHEGRRFHLRQQIPDVDHPERIDQANGVLG